MNKPVFIGIDPGTTTAYAVISTDGDILEIFSHKNLGINNIIKKISKYNILAIGTDVKTIPKTIEKISSVLNIKIIKPEKDMSKNFKKTSTKKFISKKDIKIKNDHERDALSASIFTYKHFKPLINKTKKELLNIGKSKLFNKVIKGMIYGKNINTILNELESIKIKQTKEKREKQPKERTLLINKINDLKNIITTLNTKIKEQDKIIKKINKQKQPIKINDEKLKRLLRLKDERIKAMDSKIKEKENKIDLLKKEIKNIYDSVKLIDKDNIIASRITKDNINDIKNKTINNILLLDINKSHINSKTIELLNKKIEEDSIKVIVKNKDVYNILKRNKIDSIIIKDIKKEFNGFAIIEKTRIEKAEKEKDILKKIINEYRLKIPD